MLNKIIKLCGIILLGAGLFASCPFVSYAQYYSGYGASASTISATNITPMNATLNGTVNTGGIAGNAWFEYGTDLSFGHATTLNAFNFNAPYSGNYSTNVSGLTANTTYYFRAVAQNSYGKVSGNVLSFTTDFSTSGYNNSLVPTAITVSSAVLADNTAQMNGLILTGNTNSSNSWFEWGVTPSLGNQTTSVLLGGSPAIRHTNTITGLEPGTTYYFRAVAQNSYGINYGVTMNFTTTGRVSAPVATGGTSNTTPTVPSKITSTDTTKVDNSINPSSPSLLGANVVGSGTFFPMSLLGWMILITLILFLVYLGKHTYSQFKK
jgi:phosphodiesterase/alkaline phosphatase D-like protein